MAPVLWHSHLSRAQKSQLFQDIWEGKHPLVVGARSALLLPFHALGLIVVDEAHDPSYKQEEGILYHAKDMAVARGKAEHIPVLLVSATPTLEMQAAVAKGHMNAVLLTERYQAAALPTCHLIDLRQDPPLRDTWLSQRLLDALHQTLERKEQSLVFLNRRGYAPVMLCGTCGYRLTCPLCHVHGVFHQKKQIWMCHHCGHQESIPEICPQGHPAAWIPWGAGIERIAEELQASLPKGTRICTLSSEDSEKPKVFEAWLRDMERGAIDVVVGTQVLAKGHHFPKLTCVCIVDGDASLWGGDFRAAERTYHLLQQVAGRAGRDAARPGSVWIQTYQPEHPVFQSLYTGDTASFLAQEAQCRYTRALPPFGRLASVILSGKTAHLVHQTGLALQAVQHLLEPWTCLGPSPACIPWIRGIYRERFLIKAPETTFMAPRIQHWIAEISCPKSIKIIVDIDPYSFL
jgi:primosomal protein N' (replication factor Y) (superfamily II helicase)